MRIAGSPALPIVWNQPGTVVTPPPPPDGWDSTSVRVGDFRHATGAHTDNTGTAGVLTKLGHFRTRSGLATKICHVYDGTAPMNNGSWPKARAHLDAEDDLVIVTSTNIYGTDARAFYGSTTMTDARSRSQYAANPLLYLRDCEYLEAVAGAQLPGGSGNGRLYNRYFKAGQTLGGWTQAERLKLRIVVLMHELSWSYHHAGRCFAEASAATKALYNPRIIAGQGGAFRAIVNAIRDGANDITPGAGDDLRFVWSLGGGANAECEAMYPGDNWVDIVAVNDYSDHHHDDEWPPNDARINTTRLFNWVRPFARARNKPIGMNEIGVSSKWQTNNNYDAAGVQFFTNLATITRAICNDLTGPGIAYLMQFEKQKGPPDVIGQPGSGENIAAALFLPLQQWLAPMAPGSAAYPDGAQATVGGVTFDSNYPLSAQAVANVFNIP